jgi:hypothetical protein
MIMINLYLERRIVGGVGNTTHVILSVNGELLSPLPLPHLDLPMMSLISMIKEEVVDLTN